MPTTAERIQKLRKELGLNQLELATMMKVSEDTISQWERGVRKPTGERLDLLARFFYVTKEYLLCESDVRLFDGRIEREIHAREEDREKRLTFVGLIAQRLSDESLAELICVARRLKLADEDEGRD